ncbi:MAG: insulinase family protein [Duganella sp.]
MTFKLKIIAVVGLWCTLQSATAAEAYRWDERVQRGQLDNGLTYYIVDGDNFGQQLSMQLVVRVGSLDERDDQSGVAHMVEHMVFKASKAHPEGLGKYMESLGWRIGKHYNAQTNFERTLYQIATDNKAERVNAGIGVLAEIAGHAQMPADALELERQIILEEWRTKLGVRERMDRQRRAVLREGSLYPERPTIGTEASIRQQPAESLRKFYADWYRPANMALVIVGNVDVAAVKARIAAAFGSLAPAALPARNAPDPLLKDQLRIARIQDSESGTSQVGWINRFRVDKRQDDDGWRERLIDRIAERSMRAVVRDAAGSLPAGVSSLTVRNGELGENTASLGFSSTVAVGSHQAGMRQILLMQERLRRDGVRAQDVQAELADIHRINEQTMEVYARRDFEGWQRTISEVVQANRVLQDPQQKQAQIRAAANSITVADINARVRQWIDAPDRALFMLAPGLSALTLPTVAEVTAEQQALARQPLPALVMVKKEAVKIAVPDLPELDTDGAIVRQDDIGEGVQRWTLANGDVLVWRHTPKDTVMRVVAQSDAGYRLPGAPGWQWQLAAQMGQGADLEGQPEGALDRWAAAHKVKLSQQQTETRLIYSAQVGSAQFEDLLQLYAARQVQSAPSMTALGSVGEQMARQSARRPDSAGDNAAREMSKLRYGELPQDRFPDAADLAGLSTPAGLQKVLQQWQHLSAQPVTYFISGPADTATVRGLAQRYLAGIPRMAKDRQVQKAATALQQRAGYRESRMEIGIEPQGSVRAHGSQPLQWSPERAMRTAILSRIVYRQLRTELREKEAGIYRLNYKLTLDPHNHLVSELAFTAAPERLDSLWASAKKVLDGLPRQLDNAMLDEEIRVMRSNESKRVLDYTNQFSRLQLSYNQYGDARYLKDSQQLTANLTADSVRALAQEFRLGQELAVVKVLPKKEGDKAKGG